MSPIATALWILGLVLVGLVVLKFATRKSSDSEKAATEGSCARSTGLLSVRGQVFKRLCRHPVVMTLPSSDTTAYASKRSANRL